MPHHGSELGVELGVLYDYGKIRLPKVEEEYLTSASSTPLSIGTHTARPGGLGTDPGPHFDALAATLALATVGTAEVLGELSGRLVSLAEDYRHTDEKAKERFDRAQQQVDAGYDILDPSASATTSTTTSATPAPASATDPATQSDLSSRLTSRLGTPGQADG